MTRFIEAVSPATLSIDEAKAQLAQLHQSAPDFDSSAAQVLAGLYNNRKLLPSILGSVLDDEESTLFYSPQSFYIGTGCFADGGKYILRGNVWFPPGYSGAVQALEDVVYSYDNCHDHNLDFYTVGYAGPGYVTDLFEYDRDAMSGIAGEAVALRPAGTVRLKLGSVLHFRKGIDIHTQRHPAALSVSVNLLVHDDRIDQRAQYEFDLATHTVHSTIYSTSMYPTALAFLVGELGCTEVAQPLFDTLKGSAMWQQRYAAGKALLQLGLRDDAAALARELHLPAGADLAQAANVY